MEGRIWIFGDNVDTDNIFPTAFNTDPTPEVMATHVFFNYRPDFNKKAEAGDIVIAGYNFGYGSYRETAVTGLRARGIKVIIARSFARAYYRNAINLGVLPLILGDQEVDFKEGDVIQVDTKTGFVTNNRTGSTVKCVMPTGLQADIIAAGGATVFFKDMVVHPANNQ